VSGCSRDAFAIIFPDTISLLFSVSEEADELEHETSVLPEISSVYPFCDDSSDGSDDEGTNNVWLEKQ